MGLGLTVPEGQDEDLDFNLKNQFFSNFYYVVRQQALPGSLHGILHQVKWGVIKSHQVSSAAIDPMGLAPTEECCIPDGTELHSLSTQ